MVSNGNRIVTKKVYFVSIFLTLFCCFAVGSTSVFATEAQANQNISLTAQMRTDIAEWLNTYSKELYHYSYEEDGADEETYAVPLPRTTNKIIHSTNAAGEIEPGYYKYVVTDQDGNEINQYRFKVNIAAAPTSEELRNLTMDSNRILNSNAWRLTSNDGEEVLAFEYNPGETQVVSLVVSLNDEIIQSEPTDVETVEIKQPWYESVLHLISSALDWVLDILGGILNKLLLAIADALQALIDLLMGSTGERVTIHYVIFGKSDKLNINFWGASGGGSKTTSSISGDASSGDAITDNPTGIVDTAPVSVLKGVVNYWYGVLHGIALAIYLAMFLYIGVRILLASTGSSSQKYKEMLTSWATGVLILLFFPYVMRTVVLLNQSFVGMLDRDVVDFNVEKEEESGDQLENTQTTENGEGEDTTADAMLSIRNLAEQDGNVALTIVYIILLGQLVVLLGVYYKRVFMVAFLITIFPVIAAMYIWEKIGKGRSSSFGMWMKEFCIVVLTQTFHAIVYVVLVEGAYSAFLTSQNWFIFMISVSFLFQAEKIIRSIFGMRSSANTIGDLARSGAALWATSTLVRRVMTNRSDTGDGKDQKDYEEAMAVAGAARETLAFREDLTRETARIASNVPSGSSTTTESVAATSAMDGNTPQDTVRAAQAVMQEEALGARTKKRGILSKAVSATGRATGITLGVASGLATGSVKTGLENAVVFNEIAGMATRGVNSITGYAKGAFEGRVMQVKVRSGAMDEKLKQVGYHPEDKNSLDPALKARAEVFEKALAAQIRGTRVGGKELGELKFVETIEKGTKRTRL